MASYLVAILHKMSSFVNLCIVLSVIKICRTKLKKYGLKWTLFFR